MSASSVISTWPSPATGWSTKPSNPTGSYNCGQLSSRCLVSRIMARDLLGIRQTLAIIASLAHGRREHFAGDMSCDNGSPLYGDFAPFHRATNFFLVTHGLPLPESDEKFNQAICKAVACASAHSGNAKICPDGDRKISGIGNLPRFPGSHSQCTRPRLQAVASPRLSFTRVS